MLQLIKCTAYWEWFNASSTPTTESFWMSSKESSVHESEITVLHAGSTLKPQITKAISQNDIWQIYIWIHAVSRLLPKADRSQMVQRVLSYPICDHCSLKTFSRNFQESVCQQCKATNHSLFCFHTFKGGVIWNGSYHNNRAWENTCDCTCQFAFAVNMCRLKRIALLIFNQFLSVFCAVYLSGKICWIQ